jgi:uncharacterized sulfatase
MNRWAWVCLPLVLFTPMVSAGSDSGNDAERLARPNILFVIADDLNRHVSPYGHHEVITPHVERLAAQAIRFDRAYCQYAVCSPSRVSFLSGRRPEHTGMFGNEGPSRTPLLRDAVFLPEHFRRHGYLTGRFGKVFHIGRDVPECWDVSEEGTPDNRIIYQPSEVERLGLAAALEASGRLAGGGGEGNSWAILGVPDEHLIDGRISLGTVTLIDRAVAERRPYFIACGFRRPHLPRMAPTAYFDRYRLDQIPLPAPSPVIMPGIRGPVSEKDTREALRSYYACVSFMDTQLGRVLDALDRHELWDSTIVVLLGDHGYQLGSRGGWWGKGTPYDESCATTLLIHTPKRTLPDSCQRVVEFLDLYPTLSELAGLPRPDGLEGRSLVPLLEDPKRSWNHAAFTVSARQGRMNTLAVSTEHYRYLEFAGERPAELYDIQADPRESVNLAENPRYASELIRMRSLAEDYRQRFPFPETQSTGAGAEVGPRP